MRKKHYAFVAVLAMTFGLAGGLLGRLFVEPPPAKTPEAQAPPEAKAALGAGSKAPTAGSPGPWGRSGAGPAAPIPTQIAEGPREPIAEPESETPTAPEPPPWTGPRPQFELKIAATAPEGTSVAEILRKTDIELSHGTDGKVGFRLYPGGVLGDEFAVLTKIEQGQLAGGVFTGAGLGKLVPATRALDIPFFFRNYAEVDAAVWMVEPQLVAMLEDAGWVVLGRADQGFLFLLSATGIESLEKLERSSMAMTQGDLVLGAMANVAGFALWPLATADVLTQLSTGIVDVVLVAPEVAMRLGWIWPLRFVLEIPVEGGIGFILVSRKAFDAIPHDLLPIVLEITRRRGNEIARHARKAQIDSLDQMRTRGVHLTAPADTDRAGFEQLGQEVRDRMPATLYPNDPTGQEAAGRLIARELAAVEALRRGSRPADSP